MKIRKIFRHSYVSILFVIGLAISCFVLINISELIGNMLQDYSKLHEYKFEKCVTVSSVNGSLSSNDETAAVLDALVCAQKVTTGNIYVYFPIEINKSLKQYEIRVFMKQNEKTGLSYTALEHTNKENGALIGESMRSQLLKDSDGYYIELYGVRIPILGVLDNNMAGGINRSVYLFWDKCNQQLQHKLLRKMKVNYVFCYGSHTASPKGYAQFINSLSSSDFDIIEFKPYYSGDVENAWYEMYQSFFLPLCLVFSLCNCLIVSHIWFHYRKQEIGIRKAFGYNNGQIILLFGKDITTLTLFGIVAAIIIQIIYNVLTGTALLGQQILWKIAITFLGMVGLILVNLLFILFRLRRLQMTTIITE